jgi:hypothetical protein
MPSKFIWDNLPGIALFDILKVSNAHLVYSCFNYNPMDTNSNLNCNAIQLKIYYTGERFLYETNADVVVGFMPNNEYIIKHSVTNSYPVEVINVLQGYTNTSMCSVPMSDIIATNKQFIMIRDQERGMLEYLFSKGIWDPFCKNKSAISIYSDLELSWLRVRLSTKTRFCCFIVSNPGCWQRNNFFDMLNKYKPVDSLGKFKQRLPADIVCVPDRADQDAYFGLLAQYKFMITFENNSLTWYNTEKIFNAFQSGIVPIYWGDPLIDRVYNPECFVWVKTADTLLSQYTEFKNAIDRIKLLDNDDELYMSMFNTDKKLMIDSKGEDNRLTESIELLKTLY